MQTLRDRVASAPGVQSAGLANRIPFEMNIIRTQVEPVGGPGNGLLPSVDFGIVDGGYFAAMRIAVTEGRVFSSADTPDTPRVVVINHTLARRLWPNGSAVGKHVRVDKVTRQVVGVVKDGKYLTLGEEPTPFLYLPFEQGGGAVTVVVRAADPAQALARVRENARAMDPTLPLYNVRTMDEHLEISGAPARVTATLFGAFGALALLLASVGVYGLLAWSVAQRTREIGIRRALGASDGDLVLLITAQALGPVIAGLAVGGGLAFLVSRVLQGILYSVRASDPAAYTSAVAVLLVTAAAASSMPAFRAVRIAPVDALRHE
jgi:predicted permease